jgi:putative endonuclease
MLASRQNGALYIGVTNDLIRRIYEHKSGYGSKHTSKYNIKNLVWFEQHPNIKAAIRKERRLKKYPRQWKINLIVLQNPNWRDLYMEICQ